MIAINKTNELRNKRVLTTKQGLHETGRDLVPSMHIVLQTQIQQHRSMLERRLGSLAASLYVAPHLVASNTINKNPCDEQIEEIV